jgi:hypothetical protein
MKPICGFGLIKGYSIVPSYQMWPLSIAAVASPAVHAEVVLGWDQWLELLQWAQAAPLGWVICQQARRVALVGQAVS